jgi:hypothetical protein
MGICGCGLPARCCQPAVAGGFIYAYLRSELSTHLVPQALFTQGSPVREPLLQAFPFPSTLGEVTLHPLSQACMFIYSSCGKWVFPLSCGVFLPLLLLQAFPLLLAGHVLLLLPAGVFVYNSHGRWVSPLSCGVFLPLPLSQAFPLLVARHAPPLLPSLARPGLFIYSSGRDSPPLALRVLHPLCNVSLLFLLLITQFSFFLGGGRSVQGAMLIWPKVVCGSTTYHLVHLVRVFPGHLGASIWWWPRGPPDFSIQCDVEMLCTGWRCEGVKVLPLLSGLACKVCLQCLSKISL